jgi:hypothetical protein
MNKKKHRQNKLQVHNTWASMIGIVVIGLLLIAGFPAIAKAAIAVIHTDDGQWDSNWGTPLRVDGDDPGIADDVDIDTLWVNTDLASPTTYYFGVSTVSPLRTSGGVRICVKVDCNGNGSVSDAEDRVLELNPGDTYYDVVGNDPNNWEQNPGSHGEFIGRFVEARTNNTGSISWSSCMASNPVIKAEVRDGFCPNQGTLYDETELRGYDLPTAVTLSSFSAASQAGWVGLLAGLLVGATVILRRRKR